MCIFICRYKYKRRELYIYEIPGKDTKQPSNKLPLERETEYLEERNERITYFLLYTLLYLLELHTISMYHLFKNEVII